MRKHIYAGPRTYTFLYDGNYFIDFYQTFHRLVGIVIQICNMSHVYPIKNYILNISSVIINKNCYIM